MDKVTFSSHALRQFSSRIGIPILGTAEKIRKVFNQSIIISRDEAYDINGDKAILQKSNKDTTYYKVDMSKPEVSDGLNNSLQGMIGIFVVRGRDVVTFKTNRELSIWSSLSRYQRSSGTIRPM